MNGNKAAEPDGFVINILATLDDFDIETIAEIINKIYKRGDIPKGLKISIFTELLFSWQLFKRATFPKSFSDIRKRDHPLSILYILIIFTYVFLLHSGSKLIHYPSTLSGNWALN